MDAKLLHDAIGELRQEKEQLDQVILMLELLAAKKPCLGRPSKLLAETLEALDRPPATKRSAKRSKKTPK